MSDHDTPAAAAGDVAVGDLTVNRMGFGAMRITGEGIWGPPADRDEAIARAPPRRRARRQLHRHRRLLRPEVSEELIAEALHPYPDGLVDRDQGRA